MLKVTINRLLCFLTVTVQFSARVTDILNLHGNNKSDTGICRYQYALVCLK